MSVRFNPENTNEQQAKVNEFTRDWPSVENPNDLKWVPGIGPVAEKNFRDAGITTPFQVRRALLRT